ncbi:MAG: aldo/keto reductase, partial [Gammaproteobacteria bacterium]|nr:aldo/keto reductase [Gammaproteobacteria bacterium]
CDVEGGNVTRDQLASSEQKLHSGTLDLVAVHNLKHWREQLPVLQAAKQAKQIRYVGITTSRDRQYEEFKEVLASEKLDFMQINYSLADRDAQPLLELAAEKGVAVMINLPFGRGKLFDAVQGQELPDWAAEFDADSWGQFFLKYVVSHPAVTCAIPGTTKVRHMQDNLNAAQGRLPNAEQRKKMEQFYDSL